jgi:hypothetical protein
MVVDAIFVGRNSTEVWKHNILRNFHGERKPMLVTSNILFVTIVASFPVAVPVEFGDSLLRKG